jgi:hypothetical protein
MDQDGTGGVPTGRGVCIPMEKEKERVYLMHRALSRQVERLLILSQPAPKRTIDWDGLREKAWRDFYEWEKEHHD